MDTAHVKDDYVLVALLRGWTACRDDLGDWLWSGSQWHNLPEEILDRLLHKGLVKVTVDDHLTSCYTLSESGVRLALHADPYTDIVKDVHIEIPPGMFAARLGLTIIVTTLAIITLHYILSH